MFTSLNIAGYTTLYNCSACRCPYRMGIGPAGASTPQPSENGRASGFTHDERGRHLMEHLASGRIRLLGEPLEGMGDRIEAIDAVLEHAHGKAGHLGQSGRDRCERGREVLESSELSKPTTATSSGIPYPRIWMACMTPEASMSLSATTPSGTMPESNNMFIAVSPSTRCHMRDGTTRRSSYSIPASCSASQ